ncbi:hypothetical protein KIPB_004406, partial [Kipferlia bialata]
EYDGLTFRVQLQTVTGLSTNRQYVLGLPCRRPLKDTDMLRAVGMADGMTLILMGTDRVAASGQGDASAVVEEEEVIAAVNAPGIQQLGNTCYLNSVLQALHSMEELGEVLGRYNPSSPNDSDHVLVVELMKVFSQLSVERNTVFPMKLLAAFRGRFPDFGQLTEAGAPMQHDAEEAMTVLLQDGVSRCLSFPMRRTRRLMDGDTVVQEEVTEETLDRLQCYIDRETTALLPQLLRQKHSSVERGSGDDKKEWLEEVEVNGSSPYLLVQMMRFAWNQAEQTKAKLLRDVAHPNVLDMAPLATPELKEQYEKKRDYLRKKAESQGEDTPMGQEELEVVEGPTGYYDLHAVISHIGRSANSGHYVCWAKKRDQWLLFDDEQVSTASDEEIRRLKGGADSHIAYMLIYQARDTLI